MDAQHTRGTEGARTHTTLPGREHAVSWDSPDIESMISACGLRPTRARRIIVAMLGAVRIHPTVDELQALLRDHHREIRQATLYQNLSRLTKAGVITSFADSRGLLRFDANTTAHHHLLCTECGRIADAETDVAQDKRLEKLVGDIAEYHQGWRIANTRMELRAVCPSCRSSS